MTWSEECSGGLAEGTGTLSWSWSWDWLREGQPLTHESTGQLQDGKKHGKWIERYPDEVVAEGAYEEGNRHGRWVFRAADGTTIEGDYRNGNQHGQWVEGLGGIERKHLRGVRYGGLKSGGKLEVAEGSYVDGKLHGHWVWRYSDGDVVEQEYKDDKRHGYSVIREVDGVVREEGPFVDDKQHGRWVFRLATKKKVYVEVQIYENGNYVRTERTWTERRRKEK